MNYFNASLQEAEMRAGDFWKSSLSEPVNKPTKTKTTKEEIFMILEQTENIMSLLK